MGRSTDWVPPRRLSWNRHQPWLPGEYVIAIATSEFLEVLKPYRDSIGAYGSRLTQTRFCIETVDRVILKMMGRDTDGVT